MTNTKLTAAQVQVLASMEDKVSTSSGRFGWSSSTMKSLEAKGLFRKGKEYTWDTDWHLTEKGYLVVQVGTFFRLLRLHSTKD